MWSCDSPRVEYPLHATDPAPYAHDTPRAAPSRGRGATHPPQMAPHHMAHTTHPPQNNDTNNPNTTHPNTTTAGTGGATPSATRPHNQARRIGEEDAGDNGRRHDNEGKGPDHTSTTPHERRRQRRGCERPQHGCLACGEEQIPNTKPCTLWTPCNASTSSP